MSDSRCCVSIVGEMEAVSFEPYLLSAPACFIPSGCPAPGQPPSFHSAHPPRRKQPMGLGKHASPCSRDGVLQIFTEQFCWRMGLSQWIIDRLQWLSVTEGFTLSAWGVLKVFAFIKGTWNQDQNFVCNMTTSWKTHIVGANENPTSLLVSMTLVPSLLGFSVLPWLSPVSKDNVDP